MIDSGVGLVEGHVGSGGSRFSESILERWHFAIAFHVLLNSFTICLIVGVERFDLMIFLGSSCTAAMYLSGCPDLS